MRPARELLRVGAGAGAGAFLAGAFLAGAFLAGAFLAGAFLAGVRVPLHFLARNDTLPCLVWKLQFVILLQFHFILNFV